MGIISSLFGQSKHQKNMNSMYSAHAFKLQTSKSGTKIAESSDENSVLIKGKHALTNQSLSKLILDLLDSGEKIVIVNYKFVSVNNWKTTVIRVVEKNELGL